MCVCVFGWNSNPTTLCDSLLTRISLSQGCCCTIGISVDACAVRPSRCDLSVGTHLCQYVFVDALCTSAVAVLGLTPDSQRRRNANLLGNRSVTWTIKQLNGAVISSHILSCAYLSFIYIRTLAVVLNSFKLQLKGT